MRTTHTKNNYIYLTSFHILIGNKRQYVHIENMAMLREGTNFWTSSFVRLSIKVCPEKTMKQVGFDEFKVTNVKCKLMVGGWKDDEFWLISILCWCGLDCITIKN
jgi:hypothetical protein